MARDKEVLASRSIPIQDKMRQWIALTYAYFDKHPDAFTFALLMDTPGAMADDPINQRQGAILMEMMAKGRDADQIRDISPALALSHFSGLMLNLPLLINEERLPGPASQYVDEVAEAAW